MSNKGNKQVASAMRAIGAVMMVLAWIFGWIPELGMFLFIGGIAVIIISIFFN